MLIIQESFLKQGKWVELSKRFDMTWSCTFLGNHIEEVFSVNQSSFQKHSWWHQLILLFIYKRERYKLRLHDSHCFTKNQNSRVSFSIERNPTRLTFTANSRRVRQFKTVNRLVLIVMTWETWDFHPKFWEFLLIQSRQEDSGWVWI